MGWMIQLPEILEEQLFETIKVVTGIRLKKNTQPNFHSVGCF